MMHWTKLTILENDGRTEVQDETRRIKALDELRRTGAMRGYFLGQTGEPHENNNDASTWGPQEIDWTGFPMA